MDAAAAGATEPGAKGGVVYEGGDGAGEGGRVAGGDEDACLLAGVRDGFGGAVNAGGDHGTTCGHGFEGDVWEAFPEGGEDQEVEAVHERGDVAAEAEEVYALGEAVCAGAAGEGVSLGSGAGDPELGGVARRGQEGEGVNEVGEAFLRFEAGDGADEWPWGRGRDGGVEAGACGGVEFGEVEAVSDDDEFSGVESGVVDEEASDGVGVADDSAGLVLEDAVGESPEGAFPGVGGALGGDQHGDAAGDAGEAPEGVGGGKPGVEDVGAEAADEAGQAQEDGEVPAGSFVEDVYGYVGVCEEGLEGAAAREAAYGGGEAARVEATAEVDELSFGACRVEGCDDVEYADH